MTFPRNAAGASAPAMPSSAGASASAASSGAGGATAAGARAGAAGSAAEADAGRAGSVAGAAGLPQPSAAGTGAAGAAAGQAGTASDAGMPMAGAMSPPMTGKAGVLPAITDPGAKGMFEIEVTETIEGLDTHILIAPKDLGRDGLKHPIVIWINGAGANSSSYRAMLDNVAAHGFFVLDDKQSSFESQPEVDAQRAAIEWAVQQAQSGPYAGKIDPDRIAIAGHSMGSVSTFGNVANPRVKTSIHMAGGLTGNPEGVDESWLDGLHAPAAFLCGSADSGLTRARNDFAAADPQVPLFLGVLAGVGHTDEFSAMNGGRWGRIVIAWLRWKLADDESFASSFVGPSCEFCKGDWTAMKHAID